MRAAGERGPELGRVASWARLGCACEQAGRLESWASLAPWAEMAFLFSSPFLISFLFLVPLYLLPRALDWSTCVAYHVFTQVGSTRVYYGSRNPMPRVGIDGH